MIKNMKLICMVFFAFFSLGFSSVLAVTVNTLPFTSSWGPTISALPFSACSGGSGGTIYAIPWTDSCGCTANGGACSADATCCSAICGTNADNDGYFSLAAGHTGTCQATSKPYTDCYDSNANANPAATAWFTTNRGDGSYDYDCNTIETKQYSIAACYTCAYESGWISSTASCGVTAAWCDSVNIDTCSICFTKNMRVKTSKGFQPITEVKIGDKVISYNPKAGIFEEDVVLKTSEHITDNYYNLTLDNGVLLEVTSEHPILIGNNNFVKVKDIKIGDKVGYFNDRGNPDWKTVKSKKIIHKTVDVFNLTTEKNHTFIVENVIVHNKAPSTCYVVPAGCLSSSNVTQGCH